MNRNWIRIVLLVVVLASLAIVPAYSQSPASTQALPIDFTFFPATGDTLTLDRPPVWRVAEDRAEGWRTFEGIPEMGRIMYTLVIANGLFNDGQLNIAFRVNNEKVGTLYVVEGEPTTVVTADFEFEPLTGPDYKLLIELENTIDPIQGGISIPLDTSTLLAFVPFDCPFETALNSPSDAEGLALLRRFRNEMLGTNQALLGHVNTYYEHSAEALAILSDHPLLLARTARLLRRSLPAVQALLDGEGQDRVLPRSDLRAAGRLLDDIGDRANPELASALDDLRGLLLQFEGRSLAEGWQRIASP